MTESYLKNPDPLGLLASTRGSQRRLMDPNPNFGPLHDPLWEGYKERLFAQGLLGNQSGKARYVEEGTFQPETGNDYVSTLFGPGQQSAVSGHTFESLEALKRRAPRGKR